MFSRITGALLERDEERALLEAGGLAYEIVLPPCVAEKMPSTGNTVSLEIYAQLSIDGNSGRFTFFGFTNAIEREFFEALITVASIGPKSAARAFSQPMAKIARAIELGDLGALRALPGIGPQKARDIVAKLQGRVTRFLLIQDAPEPAPQPIPDFASEALSVLLQLAYRRDEAEAMIAQTLRSSPRIDDPETLLAEIYRRRGEPKAAS